VKQSENQEVITTKQRKGISTMISFKESTLNSLAPKIVQAGNVALALVVPMSNGRNEIRNMVSGVRRDTAKVVMRLAVGTCVDIP
jgi:hypothetical protein